MKEKINRLIDECLSLEMECIRNVAGKKSLQWLMKGSQRSIKFLNETKKKVNG
jgi:hypothetical protein